ncbi:hypothetical protein MNBD_GAMMA07-539, partial [hydrothermal vent metagenome]
NAKGGNGGLFENDSNAFSSNGGNAISTSSGLATGNSQITVSDSAIAGSAGLNSDANGGNATSSAIGSNMGSQQVLVRASAVGGSSSNTGINGWADASASATGITGTADARADSGTSNNRNYVGARSVALIAGDSVTNTISTSRAVAHTNIKQTVFDRNQINGVQSAAYATLLPSQTDAATIVAGNTNVEAVIGTINTVAIGLLGGTFSDVNSAIRSQLFTSEIDLNIDMAEAEISNLIVGFLDPVIIGDHGFDSLRFRIDIEGTQVLDNTFNDFTSSISFFDDNVLDFGAWTNLISDNNVLDVTFTLDQTEQHQGEGFSSNFILAAGANNETSPVPLPAAFWLFSSGLMGLIAVTRKRLTK